MFHHRLHRAVVLLAAALAASLSGCIGIDPFAKPDGPQPFEVKEELFLMPDGSGKMTFTLVGLRERPAPKEETAAALAEWEERPHYPSAFYCALFEGAVAFSPIRGQVITDRCGSLSYTVYFHDVNNFRFAGWLLSRDVRYLLDENRRGEVAAWKSKSAAQLPWTTFRFAESGDGFSLEVHDAELGTSVRRPDAGFVMLALMLRYLASPDSDWDVRIAPWKAPHWKAIAEAPIEGDDPDGSKAARKAFAERVLQGRRFEQTCTMPGDITKASTWTSHEGRTARLTVMSKEVQGRFLGLKEGLEGQDKGAQAKLAEQLAAEILEERGVRKIQCGPSSVPEETVAAFKKEFEQAKAEWDAHLEKQAMETAKRQAWSNAFTEAARLGGDREAVRRVLQPLVDKDPWRALHEAGRFQRRYPAAVGECYQLIIDKNPDGDLVERAKQRLDETRRLVEQAKQRLEDMRRRKEKEKEKERKETEKRRSLGLLQAARNLLGAGRVEHAKDRLEEIVTKYPRSTAAPGAREVLSLLKKGKVEDGKKRLQEIIDEHTKAP